MSKSPNAIKYVQAIATDHPDVTLLKLPVATYEIAKQTLGLLADSYADEFENDTWNVPSGSMIKYFRPSEENAIATMQSKMLHEAYSGAAYWLMYEVLAKEPPRLTDDIIGFLKYSPSYSSTSRLPNWLRRKPNVQIDEIAVSSQNKHRGLGLVLLHTALKHSGYDENKNVTFDMHHDETTEQRLGEIGLVAAGYSFKHEKVSYGGVDVDLIG